MPEGPFTPLGGGVRVAIRLTPRASSDRLIGVAAAAAGGEVLKACVAAAPESGRANEALLRMLARAWRLPRRDLAIVSGASSRNKVVLVAGDPEALLPRLRAAVAALPTG